MTSEPLSYKEAYVWIWLPEGTEPVVAGKLSPQGNSLVFNYGKSYLERTNAIPIYDAELPLEPGALPLLKGLSMPGCLRDAAPDAWGRRVIINRLMGHKGADIDPIDLAELTYMLESGSDRIGALDFQHSPSVYEPRSPRNASLEELLDSAERVEQGIPLTSELDQALFHGSSIGGARPKALIEDENKKYIAKFSSSSDLYSVVKAEFMAMRLACIVGLNAAEVTLRRASGRDVLLIERFDRIQSEQGWLRKNMISALTLFELDEMMARYAGYDQLAEMIRFSFNAPTSTLKELFGRIVFNILTGNTDDHARNHAAFFDGERLSLTPAYDICPQNRAGNEASQAMILCNQNRMSRVSLCLEAAPQFLLKGAEALTLIENQIHLIGDNWRAVCEEAQLTEVDGRLFWGRQFLNPFCFEDLEGDNAYLRELAEGYLRQGPGDL